MLVLRCVCFQVEYWGREFFRRGSGLVGLQGGRLLDPAPGCCLSEVSLCPTCSRPHLFLPSFSSGKTSSPARSPRHRPLEHSQCQPLCPHPINHVCWLHSLHCSQKTQISTHSRTPTGKVVARGPSSSAGTARREPLNRERGMPSRVRGNNRICFPP